MTEQVLPVPNEQVREWNERLRQALLPLELPDGPKLGDLHLATFEPGRGLVFNSRSEATLTQQALSNAEELTRTLSSELGSLPLEVIKRMEWHSRVLVQKFDNDGEVRMALPRPEHCSYRQLLVAMRAELMAELDRVNKERETYWGGGEPGTNPDMKARMIALEVAKIFIYLRPGQMPNMGKKDGTPRTAFTQAVSEVFKVHGVEVSFRSPCEYAIKRVKAHKKSQRQIGA